jgi:hypothetical protein
MSGVQKNEQLKFEPLPSLPSYAGKFEDSNGNLWQVSCSGHEESVRQILESMPISIKTEPIDEKAAETASQDYKRLNEPSKKRISASNVRASAKGSEASDKAYMKQAAQEEEIDTLPAMPPFTLDVELLEMRQQPPFTFDIELDPDLTAGSVAVHKFVMPANGTLRVECTASGGNFQIAAYRKRNGIVSELADTTSAMTFQKDFASNTNDSWKFVIVGMSGTARYTLRCQGSIILPGG